MAIWMIYAMHSHPNIRPNFLLHLVIARQSSNQLMSKSYSLRTLLSGTSLPRNEAHVLMAHVLDKHYQLARTTIISHDEMELNKPALEEWQTLESRRLHGEPVAYLIGKKGFRNIELQVAPGVLIPRPETELLIDIALQEIKRIEDSVNTPRFLIWAQALVRLL
jgi:release factor glutamine methyltransferase